MAHIEKVLDKLPVAIKTQIQTDKTVYNHELTNKTLINNRLKGYLLALEQLKLITQAESRLIYTYVTL